MAKLTELRKTFAHYLTEPPVRVLSQARVTPNTVTWVGFLLALVSAALIATGHLVAAGFVLLLGGYFDIVDGALARRTGQVTPFGGVLDSTLDRLSEAVSLLGILILYLDDRPIVLLVGVALLSSPLVSYVRSRAETIGLECQVGVFTRGERVIVLVLGLWLSQVTGYALPVALALIAGLSIITVAQRLFHVWRQTKAKQP